MRATDQVHSIATSITIGRVRTVCAARDWHLLKYSDLITEDEFLQQANATFDIWLVAEYCQAGTVVLLERAIIHEYSALLHEAVGQRGTLTGDRALIEIWNYITPLIRKIVRDDELAQDVAMEVLLKICDKHQQVQAPGAFLGWCAVIARRAAIHSAARAARRSKHERPISALIPESSEEGEEEYLDRLRFDDGKSLPLDPDRDQRTSALEARIHECLRRMRHGAEVFIGLALRELPVSEIAQQLGMKANAVYVIFHRARKRLQGCGPLMADLGVALGAQP